jgi:hypothetical protein
MPRTMAVSKSKSKQPMDGDLTMRQSVAARLESKLNGLEVHWKFGHASFQTDDGKVFCFVNRDGNLAMKLPAAMIASLLENGDATPLRMGPRTLREWIVIGEPESPETIRLLSKARIYVESLPKEKPARKRPAPKKLSQKKS